MCPKESNKLVKEREGISYLVILEERRLMSDLIALFRFLGRSVEEAADCFTLVPSDRTCGESFKATLEEIKTGLSERVIKHSNKFPGGVVNVLSLPKFKRYLDCALNNMPASFN